MNQANLDYLKQKLKDEKAELNRLTNNPTASFDDKFNCLNNILEIKKMISLDQDGLYIDYKRYFKWYLKAIDEKDNGYDNINIKQISEKLNVFVPEKKIDLLRSFKRELTVHAYINEANQIENLISESYLELYKRNFTVINFLKCIALWSSLRVRNLIISLSIAFAITCLIFLPAPFESWEIIVLDYQKYSNCSFFNHLLNVLTILFDFDSGMTVKASNGLGVLLMILGKSIYVLILLNYLVRKLITQFNLQS